MQLKVFPNQPIGEFNFVGKKRKYSPSSTRDSHSDARAKKHIPAVSSMHSEQLFRVGDQFSVGMIAPL